MDVFLGRITSHAMNYAIRSGITITTGYAIKQCGRLLKETPKSQQREELMSLQLRLESKIRIISPAIDMIELISARGNTSLESAASLTKEIRYEIQRLGVRLSDAANEEELLRRKSSRAKAREHVEHDLITIISQIKKLLVRIEDAVPLISLAITTSGVNLSTKLSGGISPSRLLQASTFLTAADSKYASQPGRRVQVGPTYTLSMYMLFAGHARTVDEEGLRNTTWKEVIHKAKAKLIRVPLEQLYDLPGDPHTPTNGTTGADSIPSDVKAAEFAYQLLLIEDLDDDRVHTFENDEAQPGPFQDVASAGIRDIVPIHEVSKVFYADTCKILNIGGDSDSHNPVLLLRRDVHAEAPRRMLHRSQMGEQVYFDESEITENGYNNGNQSEIDAQMARESAPGTPDRDSTKTSSEHPDGAGGTWRLPADLDPEWMAFEVFTEEPDSESELEEATTVEPSRPSTSREDSLGPGMTAALSKLRLNSPASASNSPVATNGNQLIHISPTKASHPPIKTSLSLLEMLLKLTALQQFRQESHLSIEDELLNFFLEDSATAGAGADKDFRQRVRREAVRRVGFDPYDESPVKRRGEEYIQRAQDGASPRAEYQAGETTYDYDYGLAEAHSTPGFVRPSIEQPRYAAQASPSSPSPAYRQTPPRSSPPVAAKSNGAPRPASQPALLATPSSTALMRPDRKPNTASPLGREYVTKEGDEGLGTSPRSEDLEAGQGE